ncbi:Troponin I, fast skeletal muscle [Liparis tanakae]|uniref:Troponin I, fast skeletal muscle n=1 Tax=Liparis tanakae TaxID=230148 RepID=A0A4Z2E662_9TELE|nr:Troponin I, fast skeletal muscle [Liparis tanakae]
MEVKVSKSNKEVEDLKIKVQDLKGKFKKPVLKKVRMSADAMLAALLGSKHKVSMDLRGNLRQVRKEVKEEVGAARGTPAHTTTEEPPGTQKGSSEGRHGRTISNLSDQGSLKNHGLKELLKEL